MSDLLELPQTRPAGGGHDDGDDLVHLRCRNCDMSPCGHLLDVSGDLEEVDGAECVVCFAMWEIGDDSPPCARCGQ